MKIKIGKKCIGDNCPVFIVAEAGINHNGNIKTAKKMVSEAKRVGADAIKFQTFKASDLATSKSKFFKIFKNLEFGESEFKELSDYANSKGIIFCSTPFSENALDMLSKLHVPLFKIASGDLTHTPLLQHAAKKKKPMIISTGLANMEEVKYAVSIIRSCGNNKIIILHSVSAYPTPPHDTNLNVIKSLKKTFNYPVGYSDNGPDLLVPTTAVAVGAKVIEKHFTLNRKMKGPDQKFSADPKQFSELVKKIREIEKILGDGKKRTQPSEMNNKVNARRSIIANTSIKKGIKITEDMISFKRPATGIPPKFFQKVIGSRVKKSIVKDNPIKWQDLI